MLKQLLEGHRSMLAADQDEAPVLMFRNDWEFGRFVQEWPGVEFTAVRERS